jgi:hypothetical protein
MKILLFSGISCNEISLFNQESKQLGIIRDNILFMDNVEYKDRPEIVEMNVFNDIDKKENNFAQYEGGLITNFLRKLVISLLPDSLITLNKKYMDNIYMINLIILLNRTKKLLFTDIVWEVLYH